MDTFALHPLWVQDGTPVQPIEHTQPAQDLVAVAEQFEAAIGHLQRGELTAGTALANTALGRFRSLLGEPDRGLSATSLPPVLDADPVLRVPVSELRQRMAGLIRRGVPMYVSVDHAETGAVLSRLYVTVDVTA